MTQRFVAGLSYCIRIHVVGLCCETVDRAIVAAMSVECKRELFRTEQQHRDSGKGKSPALSRSRTTMVSYTRSTFRTSWGRRFKGWFTGGLSRDRSRSQTPQQRRPPQQQQQTQSQQSAPVRCTACGRLGHRVEDCRQAGNRCFHCGSPDHHVRDCPQAPRDGDRPPQP